MADPRTDLLAALDGPARDLTAGWLDAQRSPLTADAYARDLASFLTWARPRGVDLLAVTRADVIAWLAALRSTRAARGGRPLAPATQARRVAALGSWHDHAREVGAITHDPMPSARHRPRPEPDGQTRALTVDQVRTVCAQPPHALLWRTLYVTGARITEALSIDVQALRDHDGDLLARVRTKRGRHRDLHLTGLADAVRAAAEGRDRGPLFTGPGGARLDYPRAAYAFARAAAAAGVEGAHLHQLRASCATHMLAAGVPLADVQRHLGHASPAMTIRYRDAADLAVTVRVTSGVTAGLLRDGAA